MANRPILLLPAILFAVSGPGVLAQMTRPAGPAATVAEFRQAMDGIDPAVVSRILIAGDAGGHEKIAQLQRLANALARLRAAVAKQFGAKTFYLREKPLPAMDEKIDGDSATVDTPDGKSVHLRQVNNQWRIPIRQEDGDAIEEHLAELQVMTEAIESIAADTEADHFDTADEVLRAAQEELTRGRAIRKATTAATTSP